MKRKKENILTFANESFAINNYATILSIMAFGIMTLSIMTFSIATLSIQGLFATLSKNTQNKSHSA